MRIRRSVSDDQARSRAFRRSYGTAASRALGASPKTHRHSSARTSRAPRGSSFLVGDRDRRRIEFFADRRRSVGELTAPGSTGRHPTLAIAVLSEAHSRTDRVCIIGFKEEDPSLFQSAAHGVDICGRAAAGAKLALHAHDRRQRHARFLRQGRLAPTQQRAGRPDLGRGQHDNFIISYDNFMLTLALSCAIRI